MNMTVLSYPGRFVYISAAGDWRLEIGDGRFDILPQVGAWNYSSGANLDSLAALIVSAKAHAVANGINWENN
jgi:hypothetical protein